MAPRGKLVLARINNQTKRRASLRKRQAGLLKKVRELSTLCDAEAAIVIYSPGDEQPKVWPSVPDARATIAKFLSRPELERMKNTHTAKSFMEERCVKKKKKALRLTKMNEKRYVQALITSIYNGKRRIQDIDSEQEKKVSSFVDKKKEELLMHIQKLKRKEQQALDSPQLLLPASQARSGVNVNGLIAGRDFNSPAAANEEMMNFRDSNPLPSHSALVMSPCDLAAKRHAMTRRLDERTHYQPKALLPQALQMPEPSIQVENGLVNCLASGRNLASPASAAYGQLMNLRGMTLVAPSLIPLSLPIPNLLVISPKNSAANSLSMTQSLSIPPPALSAVPTVFSAGSVPSMSGYSLISPCTSVHIGEENFGMMKQHASLPLDYSLLNPSSNILHMTGRLSQQMNFGVMMQHSLDRTFSEDGHVEGMIQHGPPPRKTLELPRRLGLPPTPQTRYEASGSKDECDWNRVRFPTPATTAPDQGNFGNDYRWNINGFPAAANAELERNFDDVMSNAGWADGDTALEFRNA